MKRIGDYLLEAVLAILAIFVMILIIAPYFFGYSMQSDYKTRLQELSTNTEFTYEVISYNRNWFNTDADLLVKNKENQVLFYLRQQIIHGPLYLGLLLKGDSPWVNMVIKGRVLFDKKDNTIFSKLFSANNAVIIDGVVRFNDDVIFEVIIPEIDSKLNGDIYKLSDMNLDIHYSSDSNRFLGEFSIPDLMINYSGLFEIKDLILSFNQAISGSDITGDLVISFDVIKFNVKKYLFDIRQFSSRLKNEKTSNIISADLDLKVSKINLFNQQMNSLSLDVSANGLEYNVLKNKFLAVVNDSQDQFSDISISDYHYQSVVINRFDFFTEHGGFASNLSLKSEISDLDVDKNYFSDKDVSLNVSAGDVLLKKIYQLIVMAYQNTKFNTSKDFVDSLLSMKYIENINNKYKFSLRNKDGKFLVNDFFVSYDELTKNLSSSVFIK